MVTARTEQKRVIWGAEKTLESLFQTLRNIVTDFAAEEARVMKVWPPAPKYEKDSNDETRNLEGDAELSDRMEIPMEILVTPEKAIAVIAGHPKKTTATMMTVPNFEYCRGYYFWWGE